MGWVIGVGRRPSSGRRRRSWSPGGSRIESLESRALRSATPVLVKDINPGGGGQPGTSDGLYELTNVDGTLFFAANSDLWKSDGTAAGTVRIVHYAPSNTNVVSGAYSLTAFNDLLLFGANDQDGGRKLWRSDGTPAGTFPLVGQNFLPSYIRQAGGIAFAEGATPGNGSTTQLWRTDGTVAGTVLLKKDPNVNGIVYPIAVVGRTVFFGASGADGQPALWKSDGTVAGTVQVKADVRLFALTAFNGELFFSDKGLGFWKSDGTEAGTVEVSSSPQVVRGFVVVGDTLFFLSQSAVQGNALWKSDGTVAGTTRVADLPAAPSFSNQPFVGTDLNGLLVFYGPGPGPGGLAPWRSDGTASGTFPLADIAAANSAGQAFEFITAGGLTFFAGADPGHGLEPWETDGTVAGTSLVADLIPGPAGSEPTEWTAIGRTIFFTADDGTRGEQLWKETLATRPVTGSLTPASDSGVSHTDAVTNVVRPTFVGTAEPGADVQLFARSASQATPRLVGQAVADAAGAWLITTIPLADGSYAITANATAPDGHTAMARLLPSTAAGPLLIDTVAPVVEGLKVEPLRGRFLVAFQDGRSGMDQSTLLDRANYRLRSPYRRYRHVSITGLDTTQPAAPTTPQPVRATINGGVRLKHARYVLSIVSGGIRDLAGNPLDGTFNGTFPSGNGRPGSNFVALLPTNGIVAFPPRPLGAQSRWGHHSGGLNPPGRSLHFGTPRRIHVVPAHAERAGTSHTTHDDALQSTHSLASRRQRTRFRRMNP